MTAIAVLRGDGIGAEVTAQALRVLQAVRPDLDYVHGEVGGRAIDRTGTPYPEETERLCKRGSAILFGACNHFGGGGKPAANLSDDESRGFRSLRRCVACPSRRCAAYRRSGGCRDLQMGARDSSRASAERQCRAGEKRGRETFQRPPANSDLREQRSGRRHCDANAG